MNNIFAVLLDITSIQKYIFESNKLKDNLGASYLIQEVYNSFLSLQGQLKEQDKTLWFSWGSLF